MGGEWEKLEMAKRKVENIIRKTMPMSFGERSVAKLNVI